ncbi:MotA/TolQ/ExbB proton channel family protein [Endozoicomonas gorgoniicola]|uniref:MotA/TolQ/ExbB proton channel family protein n=1 Tax=Endozoicomonas gorgoniicola TaxID=1234144 RepID=A0ABT3N3S3_9GAMM|nr:MotA/TolQ/ExbB proton channel family protein [Endozoicomonas gorgoniicola]MCW7556279.1 MotA/TolQ/ExbB proton channel family protein [Endozoicomonas gorgoniicola]
MIQQIASFFEHGVGIIWLILLLSCVMWYQLLQGFLKVRRHRLLWLRQASHLSSQFNQMNNWQKTKLKGAFLGRADSQLNGNLDWINILIKILPLLGLLGTVDGMVTSFIQLGEADIQQHLSSGISAALLTTQAGLVTSLSGIYLAYLLKQKNRSLLALVRQALSSSFNNGANHAVSA